MSKPSLLTRLYGWWEFEENFDYGHTAMDSSPRLNHIPTLDAINPYPNRTAKRGTGRIGYGIKPRVVYAASKSDFQLQQEIESYGYTVAGWIKLHSATYSWYIAAKDANPSGAINQDCEYRLWYNSPGTTFEFRHYGNATYDAIDTDSVLDIPSVETWYFVIGWVDPTLTKVFIRANNSTPAEIGLTQADYVQSSTPFAVGDLTDKGFDALATVDNVAIWRRVLTEDEMLWLWNGGVGRSYAEINPTTTTDCEAIVCESCATSQEITTTYDSDSATDSGAGSNVDDPCPNDAYVTFDPPCGSYVVFPIWVTLTCNYPDATIYYTTDGTDPTEASTVYTGPIEVTGAATTVKAYAVPVYCPESQIQQCNWQNYGDAAMNFQVYCLTLGDHVGQWDDWTPNGEDDINWWLSINPTANIEVQRFEIYQVGSSTGLWTTGAAWATDSPITPPPPWDQTTTFDVYPLEFDEVGVGVVHSDYATTFGTITAGLHQYICYGNPIITIGNTFKLIMTLTNGQKIYAYVPYTECDDPPPPDECPFPVITSIVPGCKEITVNFTVTAPDRIWELYYAKFGDAAYTLADTDTDSGSISTTVTGLLDNTIYSFYVRQNLTEPGYAHCDPWPTSDFGSARTDRATTLTITSDATGDVPVGTAVTVTVTSANVPAGATLTVTNNNTYAGVPCGAHPWTPTINTAASCTFTINDNTTWQAELTGGCPDSTKGLVVNVIEAPTACPTAWVLANPTLEIYDGLGTPAPYIFPPCSSTNPALECEHGQSGLSEWNGRVYNTTSVLGTCEWHTGPSSGDIYKVLLGIPSGFIATAAVQVFLEDAQCWGGGAGTLWWILLVSCRQYSDTTRAKAIWAGYKALGSTPVGQYTELGWGTTCVPTKPCSNGSGLTVYVRSLTP